ncbi:DEKNAAC100254 [Brettanomyces naardenensis]|uniref:ATP-dependent 6-phosphofructokinase n=1 Tax=Brettanomyces naardenensis TaxID=13370 RepID=A0A448YF46_BRENA|nr:DEKNAAC100254 [Brettanomyces naardenensis]
MSLVSNVSFTSVTVVKTQDFEDLVKFYRSFGFNVVRIFNKDANSTGTELNGISSDSRSECWLVAYPVTRLDDTGNVVPIQETVEYSHPELASSISKFNKGVVLKIRLVSHDVHKNAEMPGRIVVLTQDLDSIRAIAKSQGFNSEESSDAFVDFYIRDPVGNMVGFTTHTAPGRDVEAEQLKGESDFFASDVSVKIMREEEANRVIAEANQKSSKKRIAVMTSGGDSPGMCAAVRAVVRAGIYFDCEVFGCYEGYSGLVQGGDLLKPLVWEDVRGWLSLGGTLIGTARCQEFRERAGRLQGAKNMVLRGIDALIVCGGDGSLTGADLFRSEWPSLLDELVESGELTSEQVAPYRTLTIVGMVGSIDNDMAMTDNTIGAYSSLERICEMVDYIDTTAASHSRAFVVEVMGRHCGWLAIMAGVCCGADYVFVPEQPPSAANWREEMKKVCLRHRERGRRKTTVIVAEGAIDDELNPITSEQVKDSLVELGLDTRVTTLGHVQRGGTAVAFDRLLATMQGVEAVKAVLESTPDTPSPMIGIQENKVVHIPLVEAVKQTKAVAAAIERKDFEAAFKLRDAVFQETWGDFAALSTSDDAAGAVPVDKRLNIAVVHVGAPTAALNAATRAAILYLLSRGHTPYGIENGFSGLIRHGAISKLTWLDVVEWHNVGGSFLGTNRSLPSTDVGTVAFYMQKFNIQGLLIIGGFEAYHALHELKQSRERYPIFNMPLVCLPSTVSNNVPGTEYSLGCDTCLNVLVTYCDAVKQSASASRRRVFVVEVQGGNCGYVASYIGLATGALAVYRPEDNITLKSVREDLKLLEKSFEDDQGEDRSGKMVIRNENASSIYTTQLIADILREEAHGKFESRTAIPGHVQQGRIPSSMDRCYAARFAIKACKFLEENNEQINHSIKLWESEGFGSNETDLGRSDTQLKFVYKHGKKYPVPELDNAKLLGIHGTKVIFEDVDELWEHNTNVESRTGLDVHWDQMNVVNDILSGRLMLRKNEGEASS